MTKSKEKDNTCLISKFEPRMMIVSLDADD